MIHGLLSWRWGMRLLETGAATGQGGGTVRDYAGEETEIVQGRRGTRCLQENSSLGREAFASGRSGLGGDLHLGWLA